MRPYLDIGSDKGIVSVDWFQLSTELVRERDGSPLQAPNGWKCILMSPTAVWGERWFIMDCDGNKVATILCSPRSSKIPCKSCNVEIANRWLYYDDFKRICEDVQSTLPMVVRGVRRVDLCCDFEMDKTKWETYMQLNAGTASIKGYGLNNVWRQKLRDKTDANDTKPSWVPHDLNFGSPESTFKWKVYYKWLELKQAPPEGQKPYILNMWRAMGFKEKYVWRVEVSVQDCNRLKKIDDTKIAPFSWYDDRVRLFSCIYADKFVVREEGGHADHRNDRVLPFLNIDGEKLLWHAESKKTRDDSDPERRIVCKLWKELNEGDVQCNRQLCNNLARSLVELLEKPSNVYAIEHLYGVDTQTICNVVSEALQ